MNSTRRILLTTLVGATLSSFASADTIGYLSNVVGPQGTEVNYSLTLQEFNPGAVAAAIGATSVTLTGAQLYFRASESTHIQLTNDCNAGNAQCPGQNQTLTTGDVHVDLTHNFNNPLNGDDVFLYPLFEIWTNQTNGTTNFVLGQCPSVAPGACGSVTVTPAGIDYGTITINDTDTAYSNGKQTGKTLNNAAVTSGTGVKGLLGATFASDNAAAYLGGGTFNLTGATLNGFAINGGGGHLSFLQTDSTATFQAEIDYTYTADFTPPGTPEPATMALVGGGLLALGLVRRRLKKS